MATVSDIRCTPEFIASLRQAGMGSVRINSAHVDAPTFRRMTEIIRNVDPEIAILMDTKGPEIRTTELDTDMQLTPGELITLCSGSEPSDRTKLRIKVDNMHLCLTNGDEILLDDGEIALEVTAIVGTDVIASVKRGGLLGSRKTVAFPSAKVPPLPAVSERDMEMIKVAAECRIDMIAHSFVRSAADVEAVRKLIDNTSIKLYAKIECREALDNLDSIARAADGLLIARGDLGTHIPLSNVPAAQFEVVSSARQAGKPTILATQILQSMMSRPSPTRAELSDITLAVMLGIDTLLLCGETAQGQFPRQCIEIMKQTINSARQIKWKISTTT